MPIMEQTNCPQIMNVTPFSFRWSLESFTSQLLALTATSSLNHWTELVCNFSELKFARSHATHGFMGVKDCYVWHELLIQNWCFIRQCQFFPFPLVTDPLVCPFKNKLDTIHYQILSTFSLKTWRHCKHVLYKCNIWKPQPCPFFHSIDLAVTLVVPLSGKVNDFLSFYLQK